MKPGVETNILFDGHVLVQTELLRHVADVSLNLPGLPNSVSAQDANRSQTWMQQPAQTPNKRRLACPVRTQQTGYRTGRDFKTDVLKSVNLLAGFFKRFRQMIAGNYRIHLIVTLASIAN